MSTVTEPSSTASEPAVRPAPPQATGGWTSRVPAVTAGVLAVISAVCLLMALIPPLRHALRPTREVLDPIVPLPPNLAYAALVAVLAAAVARRKRVGWWLLLVFLVVETVPVVVVMVRPSLRWVDDDGNPLPIPSGTFAAMLVGTGLTVIALAVLIAARAQFYARVRPANTWRALGVFVTVCLLAIALGWGLVRLFPGSLDAGERLAYAAEKVLGGAIQFDFHRGGHAPRWVSLILGLLGAVALFAGLGTLLRSQRENAELSVADEVRIRGLLAEYGERDSLGYFATRRDKAARFAHNAKAVVTYRVVGGVSLASGDPIGDADSWPDAIEQWLRQAREYAWTPAVMGASEEGAIAYSRAGLKVLQLGDEAIIQVRDFTLEGRDMRMVRQAVRRVERVGYTCRVRRHRELTEQELGRVVELASAWRDTDTERGFSMALSRLGDPADGECVLVEAIGPDGAPAGLLSFSPWGRRGLSLDLMRRDRHADNGLMEFMVAGLVQHARGLGVERISLNFAVFRSVFAEGARIGAGPVLRAWRRILLLFSRWWQLESLYVSNVKYRPEWRPRYLCLGERRGLVRVGLAAAIAEGFLSVPDPRTLFARGRAVRSGLAGARPDHAQLQELLIPVPREPLDLPQTTLPEQVRVRMTKLDRLRASGIDPYPIGFERTAGCAEIVERFAGLPADSRTGEQAAIAGRVVLLREHGGLCFATVRDWSGDLQVMVTAADTGADRLDRWKSDVDIGDHVGVSGEVITSRRGELSLLARQWSLTAKCLRPLPDKRLGLTDPEARVRHRYLDLICNDQSRRLLAARGAAVHSVRDALVRRGFLEVETPILQPIHGGANARPFTTHINAYDLRLYLRIAPELFLKRLLVGGVEKVFELGRTFRNEGVSFKHNPEFTMLEAYQAYADYQTMLELARDLIQGASIAVHGRPVAHWPGPDGTLREYDIGGTWPVRPVHEAIADALGEPVTADTPIEQLRALCDRAEVPHNPAWGRGAVVLEMYERLVEHHTVTPTFYTDFPVDVSPLTRQHRTDPRLAERWDLVAFGTELGTAYSELVDPVEQRRRLTEQSLLAAGGDPEAMELDEDFLHALEYAMPPCGGLGLGVDRLIMLLTGRTIRETLPFPLVRPR